MDTKYTLYLFMTIIMNIAFLLGIINASIKLHNINFKIITDKKVKYSLSFIFISSIVIYILYIPFILYKDWSSWAFPLGAFILTNGFNSIYNKYVA